jgi:hypothetical protein
MIEQALKAAIPSQLKSFKKLTDGHDPYYFWRWDKVGSVLVLRYRFSNKAKTKQIEKRVFINELEDLLKHSLRATRISRGNFQKYCHKTQNDGSCGFAVTIRILEHFGVVEVADREYRVKSAEKIRELLIN